MDSIDYGCGETVVLGDELSEKHGRSHLGRGNSPGTVIEEAVP